MRSSSEGRIDISVIGIPRAIFAAIFFAVLLCSFKPCLVHSQDINDPKIVDEKLTATKAGELSFDELAEFFISQALASPQLIDKIGQAAADMPGFSEVMASRLAAKMVAAVSNRSISDARIIRSLGRYFISPEASEYQSIEQQFNLLQSSESVVDSLDPTSFLGFSQGSFDGISETIKGRLLNQTFVDLVEASTANVDELTALEKLAALYELGFSDLPLQSAQPVLEQIHAKIKAKKFSPRSWPLSDVKVQQFLQQLISRDAQFASHLLSLYEWKVSQELRHNDADSARYYYNIVLAARPDPDDANNTFRRDAIASASGAQAVAFARGRIAELSQQGLLSGWDKFSLLVRGYYGNTVPFFAGVLVLLLCTISTLMVLKFRRRRDAKWSQAAGRLGEGASVGYQDEGFKATDEYSRLLAKFDLEDKATESEIKRAFREAVKQYHPDAHGAAGVAVDEEGNVDETFQELRKAYDRIMEIRGSYFGKKR